ncbi:hypothetical protein FRC09_001015, partial [Ceratobasidium sp. 395]
KRKITADGQAVLTSGSSSALKDANDLKNALKGCDTVAFVQALTRSLDNMSPNTLQTLKTTLIPLIQPDTSQKHCVRCHNTYLESSNTIESCIIKCSKPKETDMRDDDADRPWENNLWEFPCCGNIIGSEEVSDPYGDDSEDPDTCADNNDYGVCQTLKHTTDPTSVKYHVYRSEKKLEKGVNYSGRNRNIRTCKMVGCEMDKLKGKS